MYITFLVNGHELGHGKKERPFSIAKLLVIRDILTCFLACLYRHALRSFCVVLLQTSRTLPREVVCLDCQVGR